jgi:HEAT repeat protein
LLLLFLGVVVPGSPAHLSVLLRPSPNDGGRSVGQLTRALFHSDPAVRKDAATALGRLNTDATDALPRLAEVLRQDPDPDVRAAAADAICKMAPASRAALSDLAAALRDPDPRVRMHAALALLRLKEDASPAIPDLIAAAGDEDNDTNLEMFTVTVRQAVLRALGAAAAGTGAAVPTLSAVLDRPAPDMTRAIAAHGLGLAGPHARDSAPLIRALLRDPDPDVRHAAGEALARIGADPSGPARVGEYENLELPEPERKRLWEIEHRGNVLNKYGFEPLAAAVARGDAAKLAGFLAPGFAGSEPGSPTRVKSSGFADVERLQESGRPPVPVTAAQFADRLLELRKAFGAAPKVKLVVATLRPKDLANPDGAWEGQALLRMHGEAAPGAPAEVTGVLAYEVSSPTEEALATGGWLRAAHVRQLAVARSPRYLFAETAKARGLNVALHDNWTADGIVPHTGGVYVTDFDRDGYLDVLVTDLTGLTLHRGGPGGTFADVTERAGLPRKNGGAAARAAAWADLDGDGWDDLILDTRVYRNAGGAGFEDVTERCSPILRQNRSSILVADYDRDGKLDLYLTRTGAPGNLSWLEGLSNDAQGNRLFRNLGDWKFEDVTKKSGTRGGYRSTFTAAWLDANDDGWPDLHVPNEFGDGVLLVNNRDGTFKPHALSDRPADFGTMGLAVGDVDNDGRIDIYCANMYSKAGTRVIGNLRPDAYPPRVMDKLRRFVAGSQLHLNKGELKFEQAGAQKQLASVGWAYGATLADLDGDGLLDVYATAGYISRDRTKPDG